MKRRRTKLGLLLLLSTAACVEDPESSELDQACEGKCDDADAEPDVPTCPDEPESVGCCWVEVAQDGADALLCNLDPSAVAPAELELRLNRYDANGVLEARHVIDGEATTAQVWSLAGYPYTLEVELVTASDQVVGLEDGVATSERITISGPDALPQQAPHTLRAPVDVWPIDVHNRYLDEVALLQFAYTLPQDGEPRDVSAVEPVVEYGVRDVIAIAVAPGTTSLPVAVDLRTAETASSPGTLIESTIDGPGPYTIDDSGLTPLVAEEPAGDAVTSCTIERVVTPAPDTCTPQTCPEESESDCVPIDCAPTTSDTLVCTPSGALGAASVRISASGQDQAMATPVDLPPDGARVPLDPSAYPYVVSVDVELSPKLVGLDALADDERQHRGYFTLADEMSTGQVSLPFEVWEVTLTSDDYGALYPDAWPVELGSAREDRFALLASDQVFDAYEGAEPLLVPVAPGQTSLPAKLEWNSATDPGADVVELDVELGPGAWMVTEAGLTPAD